MNVFSSYRTANAAIRAQAVLSASRKDADLGLVSRQYRIDPTIIREWLLRLEQDTERWRRHSRMGR